MRRLWVIVCAAVVLLTGGLVLLTEFSHSSTAHDAVNKRAFVQQLVGYCAQVDRQLTTIDMKSQPGQVAHQLGTFASQARSHRPPTAQRKQFDILLSAIDDTVRQYRSAQTALSSGNSDAYLTALKQAGHAYNSADKAAQGYGMPHLADCAKKQGGSQQSPAVAQPAGGWQLGHDSLYPVQQVGAAVLKSDGRIWVAGGLTGLGEATAKTEFYDPTIDQWSPGPALPVPLHHAMMVSYENTVWVIGGFEPQGSQVSGVASARVLHLNAAQDQWIDGPELHHPRAAGAAAVVGDKIVVVGGRTAGNSAEPVTPTEVFDGTSWHDAAGIPIPGDHLAAASDGKYLYAVGGRKLEVTTNTAAVQRFDPNADRWTQLPAVPSKVSDCGVAIVGGRLIVVGGESTGTVFGTVRAYDLTTSTWSNLPNLAVARHGLAVAAIGNTLYAIDGAAKTGHNASTPTVQILTFHS
jgi:N-acetylneuraminic acid mutarotase